MIDDDDRAVVDVLALELRRVQRDDLLDELLRAGVERRANPPLSRRQVT